MIKPISDDIFGPNHSRYSLVVAVAKRAREIASEAEQQGDILIEKTVDLAMQDFSSHRYDIIETLEPNDDNTYD